MLGFSSRSQFDKNFSISNGLISSTTPDQFGHVRGTSGSNPGDSGGGVFCRFTGALIAICVGCDSTKLDQMSSKYAPKAHLVLLYAFYLIFNSL